ncbi:MAG TPA: flavodoxin reductase [Bacteroidia bacterium]|nr:flavodoxin reductase [Bacteroidia bacterium]
MSEHIVKILESNYITHDVKRFVIERPAGYEFIPGQATDVSINLPEWKNELRPFTFTGLPDAEHLEFTIKIYNDHAGVTSMLGKTNSGAELILHDVFGAIQYKEPGVFIAGGAGVTPFIAILRYLNTHHKIDGNKLIFSNKTSADVILEQEFKTMLKNNFISILTREHVIGYLGKRIDRDYLIEKVSDFSQHFYVCGPDEFVKGIKSLLLSLGAKADSLVFEQ